MRKNSSSSISRRTMLKGVALAGAGLVCAPQLVCASLAGASMHTQTRLLLGTFVTLSTRHTSATKAEEALGRTFEHIASLEAELTRHKSSPLTELNSTGKLKNAPQHLTYLLQQAQEVHTLSQGSFDITVAPLLDVYRNAKQKNASFSIDSKDINAAKALVQAKEVHLQGTSIELGRSGMQLTLDGIAKGYIADKASEILTSLGMDNHLVNAGGDIRVSGQKSSTQPWRVGIENPARNGNIVTSIALRSAIATSGNYEMYYDAEKKYHHLIDPKHLQSTNYNVSVSVMAPTALEADALATALSAMPTQQALNLINNLPQRECLLISKSGQIHMSKNWG